MLHNIFDIFIKITNFHQGGPWGKVTHFSQIFGCFFVVKHQLPVVTPGSTEPYTPGTSRVKMHQYWLKPFLWSAVPFLKGCHYAYYSIVVDFQPFWKNTQFLTEGISPVQIWPKCSKCIKCEQHNMSTKYFLKLLYILVLFF